MKVVDISVGKIGVANSLGEKLPESGLDAVLVAEPLLREVKLEGEISGITAFAASVAALSESCDYPLLCGCLTRFGAMRHVSVMTFASGRLADIADRTLNLSAEPYCEGDTIKILRLKRFDAGLLVDTDLLLAKNWQKIAPRCDAVIGIAKCGADVDFGYVPTLASLFGKPYAAAFSGGEILWGTPPAE